MRLAAAHLSEYPRTKLGLGRNYRQKLPSKKLPSKLLEGT